MGTPFVVRPRDKALALAHFDRLADRYAAYVHRSIWRHLRARERAAVLAAADFATARSVIDVGCGSGQYAREARRAGAHVWAVDASPRFVERIRADVDEAFVADVETLRIGRRFDVVVCAGVLDFVVDPERAVKNLLTLVDDGGRAVLLLPRAGLGGVAYRIENLGARLRVNLFDVAWLDAIARRFAMRVDRVVRPFAHNMVVRIVARATACTS